MVVEQVEVQRELFFTEGDPGLVAARRAIAGWSLPRAAARLAAARELQAAGLPAFKVRGEGEREGESMHCRCLSFAHTANTGPG